MPELVVIVGPIASGKSTVAEGLGVQLRKGGRTVAVLDLDDVVDTIGGFVGLSPERFRHAQVVHGQLVGAWLRNGADVVAHGPFAEARENEALLHAVPPGTRPRRVHLLASYDAALERVSGDPRRVLSQDPRILRLAHDRFASLAPTMPPAEWTFDTTALPAQTIVDNLTAALSKPHP